MGLSPKADPDIFGALDQLGSGRNFPDDSGQGLQGDQRNVWGFQGHHVAEFSIPRRLNRISA